MALTTFRPTEATWPKPGQYRRVVSDGQVTARLCCPKCHYQAVLDHEIDAEGRVTPSVECPDGCGYHETGVVLEGWADA